MATRQVEKAERHEISSPGDPSPSKVEAGTMRFPDQPPPPRRYTGPTAERVAFPLGGLGAGSVNLMGNGMLTGWSIRNVPALNSVLPIAPILTLAGHEPRMLTGPLPRWYAHHPWNGLPPGQGGLFGVYGLPHCRAATFTGRFPFATVDLRDESLPLDVQLEAWSPFIPSDPDSSSLPVAVLEYRLRNRTPEPVTGEFALHVRNHLTVGVMDASGVGGKIRQMAGELFGGSPGSRVEARPDGFVLSSKEAGRPWRDVSLRFACDAATSVDADWPSVGGASPFLGVPGIPTRLLKRQPRESREHSAQASPGGSFYVPVELAPGEETTVVVRVSWYAPNSDQRVMPGESLGPAERFAAGAHKPWYSGQYADVDAVDADLRARLDGLRSRSRAFADALHSSTLPGPVLEAVAANLSILRSPTVLRDLEGRMWGWEGVDEDRGSCPGTCTHVWCYAQAVPHLFPSLERTLRETEFLLKQDESGRQIFRAVLPLGPGVGNPWPAVDGQLSGLMTLHRDWTISGDDAWLATLWPAAKKSFEYSVATFDPDGDGLLEAEHHTTFDYEFRGAEPMAQSYFVGACAAMAAMAEGMGEDPMPYRHLEKLAAAGLSSLWGGEWFVQRSLDPATYEPAGFDLAHMSHVRLADIVRAEGPSFQYGTGLLTDATTGLWLAEQCGLSPEQPRNLVARHLNALVTHNHHDDLSSVETSTRAAYAFEDDGGVLLCTWPNNDSHSIPFRDSDQAWPSSAYYVACQLARHGAVEDALHLIEVARRAQDGHRRNPFNETEAGNFYARSLASYGLLSALTGVRFDKRTGVVSADPAMDGDFKVFLAWDGGFGVAIKEGDDLRIEVADGQPPAPTDGRSRARHHSTDW